jgi:hypothetical protein
MGGLRGDAGMPALNRKLGYEGARAFIRQVEGVGNWTEDRYGMPEENFEEFVSKLKRVDEGITVRKAGV